MFGRAEPPTAVACADARAATGVLRAARARGLDVPDNVSVAAFDDTGLGAFAGPALTFVRPDWAGLGRHAAAALLPQLHDPPAAPLRSQVPPVLVARGSTGPRAVRVGG
ncbi:substrate-binding domain-containing protein [Dactylosporangium sp. CA-139066]|uniref:substrate-binding domain-containing protein n=1 Tax=Dactylosporangium sp. CA-139066 TaxID=3239930 RepID=UPI003D8F0B7E